MLRICGPARRSSRRVTGYAFLQLDTAEDEQLGSPSQETRPARDPSVARAADTLAATATPGNNAYKIGPMDVLDISVFQAPELSKTVEVASNGTIDLPLLGETPAAGKSTYELQRELNCEVWRQVPPKPASNGDQ